MLPKIVSLISIVLLLGWMLYFMMGGLTLLILKHDDQSDQRLVRGFFHVHYLALITIASLGALSSAVADRRMIAASIGCIAIIGFTARQLIVSRMDRLRSTMSATDVPAIRTFRRLHVAGLALNLMLLSGFVFVLSRSSAEIVSCVDIPAGCRGEGCRVQCSLL